MLEDGRLFSLIAMLALLFFLSERMLPPASPLRRLVRWGAVGLLAAGIALAIGWSVLWFCCQGGPVQRP
ncbi:hypothetical protein [Stella sp.]|uniref:hypothetical protein n=1 Tax=Stella sp. TaxID=2912054 RepID=UPI0035B1DB54